MIKKIIYPLLILVIVFILAGSEFFSNIEHKAEDMLYVLRGKQDLTDRIMIVEIGDDTFNSLNIQWPFPRSYYAKLIENLEKAGVKEIIFDIEFTENSTPAQDSILGSVASKYDNIVFAGKIISSKDVHYKREQILTPISSLLKNSWGIVNIVNDNDGFVRRYQLFQKAGNKTFYSLGVKAAQLLDKNSSSIKNTAKYLQIGNRYIPKFNRTTTILNYFGPADHFKKVDFADVLDDESFELSTLDLNSFNEMLSKGIFKDKIVLVGVTAVEFHDVHPTPYFITSKMLTPGVEIHATFLEMFLSDSFIKRYQLISYILILLITTIVFFYLSLYISPGKSVFVALLSILVYLYIAFYLFSKQRILISVLELPLAILLTYLVSLIYHYLKTVKERKFIKDAFERYLAPNLVEELLKNPKNLHYGGEQKEITVLFSDIRSFTPYTESHSPKETVAILQEYLTTMVDVILKNKGTLDKFVGDEIMALFGVPVELDNSAYWACKAAWEMIQKLEELHIKWKKENKDIFNIGIGINTGFATVGNLGSEQIFDYTAIGDTVNAGARLEAINKQYDTKYHIIISESTYQMAKDKIIAEYLDDVLVKGKSIPIKIYQLLGIKE